MPTTHTSLHYHLVFSTHNRIASIEAKWREDLHAYMGGIVRNLDGKALRVGGVADHVHMVVGLKPTHCLSDFMRDVKTSSSAWVHRLAGRKVFAWQVGYGGFTVSRSNVDAVIEYVASQEEHHRHRTFQEEYREFLEEHGIEFDERYLW